jgi:hypothetical protein
VFVHVCPCSFETPPERVDPLAHPGEAMTGCREEFHRSARLHDPVLEDGSLFDKKLDPKNADQVVCMATGELGYYIKQK